MKTIRVLETIGYPEDGGASFQPVNFHESREHYVLSRKNKISSQYLHSLADNDELTHLHDEWKERQDYQNRYVDALENISEVMPETVEYALVKSAHGFYADSKDVDILLFDRADLDVVRELFLDAGYEFCGDSPSSVDVLDPETDIQLDIQNGFTLQSVAYFDETYVRPRVDTREYRSVDVPIIAPPDDLALIVVHSITEQLFILKEYFAALCMLQSFTDDEFAQFVKTVEENRLGPACRSFFTVVEELSTQVFDRQPPYLDRIQQRYPPYEHERNALRTNAFKTPHRYAVQTGLRTVGAKLRNELFRKSLVDQIPRMADPRVSYHILSNLFTRREREHYVHDTSSMEEHR